MTARECFSYGLVAVVLCGFVATASIRPMSGLTGTRWSSDESDLAGKTAAAKKAREAIVPWKQVIDGWAALELKPEDDKSFEALSDLLKKTADLNKDGDFAKLEELFVAFDGARKDLKEALPKEGESGGEGTKVATATAGSTGSGSSTDGGSSAGGGSEGGNSGGGNSDGGGSDGGGAAAPAPDPEEVKAAKAELALDDKLAEWRKSHSATDIQKILQTASDKADAYWGARLAVVKDRIDKIEVPEIERLKDDPDIEPYFAQIEALEKAHDALVEVGDAILALQDQHKASAILPKPAKAAANAKTWATELEAAKKAFKTECEAVVADVKTLTDSTAGLQTYVSMVISRGLKDEDLGPRLEAQMIGARTLVGRLYSLQTNLKPLAPKSKKLLEKDDPYGGVAEQFKKLPDIEKPLFKLLAIFEDALAGLDENTQQEAVRLFYFGSVPEAIKALNLNAVQYEDRFFTLNTTFDDARNSLLDAEKLMALQTAAANELGTKVRTLTDRVAQQTAELARLDLEAKGLAAKSSDFEEQIKKLQDQSESVDQTQLEILKNKKISVDDQKKKVDTQRTTLADQNNKDEGQLSETKRQLSQAQDSLASAVKSRNLSSLVVSRLAADEVDAFAFDRDHHPFWIAMPRRTSRDPIKRCMIFGYDNSNTLFIRGARRDLEAVKEILASFDRPAPQAKITIYSLQVNGDDAKKMADNISRATNQLNVLEGNLTIIQDTLRNAVAREVSRWQRISPTALQVGNNAAPQFSDRVWRSFYYPREIRRTLGLDISASPTSDESDLRYELASAIDDLKQAREWYRSAIEAHLKVLDYRRARRDAPQREFERYITPIALASVNREIALTRTGYHFGRVARYLESAALKGRVLPSDDSLALQRLGAVGSYLNSVIRTLDPEDEAFTFGLRAGAPSDMTTGVQSDILRHATNPYQRISTREFGYQGATARNVFEDAARVIQGLQNLLDGVRVNSFDAEYARSADYVTRYTLPDPIKGTTLGEILFVFSLGSKDSRERILHDLAQDIFDELRRGLASSSRAGTVHELLDAMLSKVRSAGASSNPTSEAGLLRFAVALDQLYGNSSDVNATGASGTSLYPYFVRTLAGNLSGTGNGGPATDALTPNQKEILSAIETRALENVAAQVRNLCESAKDDSSRRLNDFREQASPLVGFLWSKQYHKNWKAVAQTSFAESDSFHALGERFLDARTASPPPDARSTDPLVRLRLVMEVLGLPTLTLQNEPILDWYTPAMSLSNTVAQQNALSTANPRVAAADDMIKRFITVLEGDLNYFLINPSLEEMRRAASNGVRFGSMETESILATNRFVARVDVNATASLGGDYMRDTADASSQLAALQKALAGKSDANANSQTLGTAAALGGVAADVGNEKFNFNKLGTWSIAGALLGSVFNQSEPMTEVYTLSGGSQFKVTPIFDPSGQAMRFRFDHVQTTRVQDPEGVADPLLPRIDRHTINTEVQLSNGQFQVISSFDLNSKVGSKTRKTGGIPGLNQIPILRDIPIIGYYTMRKEAAERQHSLIFASTTMYPTVGDIVNLLIEAPPARGRSALIPDLPASFPLPDRKPDPDQPTKGKGGDTQKGAGRDGGRH